MIRLFPNTPDALIEAESIRGPHIMSGNGVLLVREDCEGDNDMLLEKIIFAVKFNPNAPIDKQNWKPDPMIILMGDAKSKLDEFEAMLPGFVEYFGPVESVDAKSKH